VSHLESSPPHLEQSLLYCARCQKFTCFWWGGGRYPDVEEGVPQPRRGGGHVRDGEQHHLGVQVLCQLLLQLALQDLRPVGQALVPSHVLHMQCFKLKWRRRKCLNTENLKNKTSLRKDNLGYLGQALVPRDVLHMQFFKMKRRKREFLNMKKGKKSPKTIWDRLW